MMRRDRWTFPLLMALAAVALVIAGCGEQASGPEPGDTRTEVPDLDDPLGGYTTRDEPPAFGDAELAESGAEEVPYDDAMASDPDVAEWQRAHPDSVRAYVVTLLWGMMSRDPSVSDSRVDPDYPVIDWSGKLRVNRGAVLLRSVISFERGDYVLPRLDRREIAWVSQTSGGYDGLRIVIYQPFEGEETGETDSLVVEAGAHRWEFLINDLAELDFEEAVDEAGNKLVLRSFVTRPEICARGFTGGAWLAPENPEEERGTFRGRWVSVNGSVSGYVRGHFGIDSRGRQVFFGKYIDLDGRFRGILRGTWDRVRIHESGRPDHAGRHHGHFRGEWVDGDEALIGHVRGAWVAVPGEGRGFFEGRWNTVCSGP